MTTYEVELTVFERAITEGSFFFYKENEAKDMIELWLQQNGCTIYSVYKKPVFDEGDDFGEAATLSYRSWKNEHLHHALPVLRVEHHAVEVVVNGRSGSS